VNRPSAKSTMPNRTETNAEHDEDHANQSRRGCRARAQSHETSDVTGTVAHQIAAKWCGQQAVCGSPEDFAHKRKPAVAVRWPKQPFRLRAPGIWTLDRNQIVPLSCRSRNPRLPAGNTTFFRRIVMEWQIENLMVGGNAPEVDSAHQGTVSSFSGLACVSAREFDPLSAPKIDPTAAGNSSIRSM
jgi:hypothetical protein